MEKSFLLCFASKWKAQKQHLVKTSFVMSSDKTKMNAVFFSILYNVPTHAAQILEHLEIS